MLNRWLPCRRIQRSRFEQHIDLSVLQPFPDISRGRHGVRKMPGKCGQGIEAIRIRYPADAPRSYPGQPPAHIVFPAKFRLLRNQLPQKGAPDFAKSHHCQVIRRNRRLSFALSEGPDSRHFERSEESLFGRDTKNREIPHFADSVRNNGSVRNLPTRSAFTSTSRPPTILPPQW